MMHTAGEETQKWNTVDVLRARCGARGWGSVGLPLGEEVLVDLVAWEVGLRGLRQPDGVHPGAGPFFWRNSHPKSLAATN